MHSDRFCFCFFSAPIAHKFLAFEPRSQEATTSNVQLGPMKEASVAVCAVERKRKKATCNSEQLALRDATATLYTDFWSPSELTAIFNELDALPDWEARSIKVWGRDCRQNRETCFYAKRSGLNYRYSGIDNIAGAFPTVVSRLCQRVEEELGVKFNFCLLNKYPNGKSTIGWHRDNESDLAPGSVIASCSFGTERFFDFRRYSDHKDKLRVILPHGSVLMMGDGVQVHYEHQIPQQSSVLETRINVTFRNVLARTVDYG